jgi:hypothetical protein
VFNAAEAMKGLVDPLACGGFKVLDAVAGAAVGGSDVAGVASTPGFGSATDGETGVVKRSDGTSTSSTSDHRSDVGELLVLDADSKHS